MAQVVVRLKAANPKDPLSCSLRVAGAALPAPIDVLADASGKATVANLADGDYTVEIPDPPKYFVVDRPDPFRFTIAGGDQHVDIQLTPLKLTINLSGIDTAKDAEAAGRGVDFSVVQGGWGVTAVASQTKPATIDLPTPGTYRIVQSVAPRPYGLSPFPRELTATVSATAPTTQVTFAQKKLTLSAQVVTADRQGAGAGAKLALQDAGGADRQVVETGTDGKAAFNPPHTGRLWVSLRSAPPGFAPSDEQTKPVEVTEQAGDPITFTVVQTAEKPSRVGFWTSVVVIVVLVVAGLLLLGLQIPAPSLSVPVGTATLIVAGFLGLLTLINLRRGFFEPLIGADNRTSTSRVAPAVWTLTLAWAIAFLLVEAGTDEDRIMKALPADRWDDYLVLLGGPFAAFVIAKGVTSWKVQSGQVQKTTNEGHPTPAQAFQNDDGATSLVDAQYLAFNLVALVYFWAILLQGLGGSGDMALTLPIIPLQLLALTGSAALTYAANKAIQNNKPAITAIEPASVRPGETVEVRGLNFRPAGVGPNDLASVTIDGVGGCFVYQPQTDTTLRIMVPPGAPVGNRNVVVTSAAKVATEPRPLEIRGDKAVLLGTREPAVRPGGVLHLLTRDARSPLDRDGQIVSVAFNQDKRTRGTLVIDAAGTETVETQAPRDLTGTVVQVTVKSPRGSESEPITVPLAQRPTFPDPTAITVVHDGADVVARLTVEGLLRADGAREQAAVLLNGQELSIIEAQLGALDARDTVVARGALQLTDSTATLRVKDWLGRPSDPIQVDVS